MLLKSGGRRFNNTVNIIQLRERFPLNGWVLSRPVMFAAATCLRQTIIEDLGCHWYPKNLGLLPMPREVATSLVRDISAATEALIEKDDNLADRWRHVEALLADSPSQSISQLIASGSSVVDGVVLPVFEPGDTLPDEIELTETGLRGDAGAFNLDVVNPDVRAVLWYRIDQKRLVDEVEVPVSFIGNCPIPTNNLTAVADEIREAYSSSAITEFEEARTRIDRLAADALGLSSGELTYIAERLATDPFLSQLRPMWAHRGLHVQGYQDHSGGDRFSN